MKKIKKIKAMKAVAPKKKAMDISKNKGKGTTNIS